MTRRGSVFNQRLKATKSDFRGLKYYASLYQNETWRRGSESNRRLLASIVRPPTPRAHPRPLFDSDSGLWPPVTFGVAFVGRKSGGTWQFMADGRHDWPGRIARVLQPLVRASVTFLGAGRSSSRPPGPYPARARPARRDSRLRPRSRGRCFAR